MNARVRKVSYILVRLLLIYIGMLVALVVVQRRLIYMPATDLQPPSTYNLSGFQEITLDTADGLKLKSWYAPPADGQLLLFYFHGNGGHIGYRVNRYQAFHQGGFGVLALEYRGYGGNPGKPTENGLYADARAAIEYAKSQGISEDRMIFHGESLGTGVATQMATEYTPRLLTLEAPFTSLANRSQELYFYVPAKWLVWDKFDSISKIGQVNAPVLIMHGTNDTIVPHPHGEKLLAAAREPKKGLFLEGIGHTVIPAQQMVDAIQAFVRDTQM